jgi:uncharacterized SAM-binding protein YcdF (DUF218 family)
MFFYLSKILSFGISPFNWLILCLLITVLSKKYKRKKIFFGLTFGILLFFTNSFIFLEFARSWEPDGTKIEDVEHYNVGVVLGGMAEYDNNLDRLSIRRGGDRLWQAIHLYHLGKIDKILISGDNGFMLDDGLKEALQFRRVLMDEGIPESDILVEAVSKNTYQNALETKKILDATPENESVLLITSALHMKRSKACFEKLGFKKFGTFTTDHFTGEGRQFQFDHLLIPNESNFTTWNALIHEWVGYFSYWVTGKI